MHSENSKVGDCFLGTCSAIAIFLMGCSKSDGGSDVVYRTETNGMTRDIKHVEGNASYQVVGGRPIAPNAKRLHDEARKKGEGDDLDGALTLLAQATLEAPHWAYPRYDAAFTLLLKGEDAKALDKYREVDKLEPQGFFTTKTAIWALEREQKGKLQPGTYLAYLYLESQDRAEKANLVDQLIRDRPTFTPAWKEKALLTEDPTERLQLIEKALKMEVDPETYAVLVLNKAAGLHSHGKSEEARKLVRNLIESPTSTASAKAMGREFLKTF